MGFADAPVEDTRVGKSLSGWAISALERDKDGALGVLAALLEVPVKATNKWAWLGSIRADSGALLVWSLVVILGE